MYKAHVSIFITASFLFSFFFLCLLLYVTCCRMSLCPSPSHALSLTHTHTQHTYHTVQMNGLTLILTLDMYFACGLLSPGKSERSAYTGVLRVQVRTIMLYFSHTEQRKQTENLWFTFKLVTLSSWMQCILLAKGCIAPHLKNGHNFMTIYGFTLSRQFSKTGYNLTTSMKFTNSSVFILY